MWDGDIAALRLEYLFALGHVCHVSPAASWDLTLIDFAVLMRDIDAWAEAQQRASSGA